MEHARDCCRTCAARCRHKKRAVHALEAELRIRGARILIADTSGAAGFTAARKFYAAKGYDEEARIRDFWGTGDDKVTYWKSLITD